MADVPKTIEDLRLRLGIGAAFPVREGGWFLPTWRSDRGRYEAPIDEIPPSEGGIPVDVSSTNPGSTGYYVLARPDHELGALHILKCDEIYTFVEGEPVEFCQIAPDGQEKVVTLGHSVGISHSVVPGGTAHAVKSTAGNTSYSLLHVVTVPGFVDEDASIPSREELQARFPEHANLIESFTHASVPVPPPASQVTPYLEPTHESVKVVPILTVGDEAGGVRFGGVPDGLGAFRDPDNPDWMRVLVTHELQFINGRIRSHGAVGAYVSEWKIDLSDWDGTPGSLRVLSGSDLIRQQHYWSHSKGEHPDLSPDRPKPHPFERLCSADLPAPTALYFEDADGAWGTHERLFLGGEETHTLYRPDHGRALAHVVTSKDRGKTWELPRFGRCSYENIPLCPLSQKKTIGVCLDDATNITVGGYSKRDVGSEVYIFVGEKQKSEEHDPVKAAGLLDGILYGLKVKRRERSKWVDVPSEHRDHGFGVTTGKSGYRFELEPLRDRSKDDPFDEPGVAQQKESLRLGLTRFLRVEDGAWDPRVEDGEWDPRAVQGHQFYFVTTDEYDGNSRLFGLIFDDITEPERGGEIRVLLQGLERGNRRFQMLDSITVDRWGRVLLQEDPGRYATDEYSRTLVFDTKTCELRVATQASKSLFADGSPDWLTSDEETSGIIPVFDLLGDGWYLTNVQAHSKGKFPASLFEGLSEVQERRLRRELVEPGQMLAVKIPLDISKLPEV